MSGDPSAKSQMLELLETNYHTFKTKLAKRLGSEDVANEVLHETWLTLERSGDAVEVLNPRAYILRVALNLATAKRQSERKLTLDEISELRGLAGGPATPADLFASKDEIEILERAIDELPPRQREILLLARVENVPHADIAKRFGLSRRMVLKDLRAALEHCGARVERKIIRRFGPRDENYSSDQGKA